ncbi:GNAT family N-acetyltransferase [Streptomyces oceani]|uniref:N-acetyltransferase domain-containing protein n=1 Tax=Streptomyces oceani TaxID=1075402 RepID=A0A1E7JRQ2_9ACTN|nr:GNAT family protein [Streptomyces oceani]OEU91441.1 hypothetical protein AN216_25270 [Streptomyces oceani]
MSHFETLLPIRDSLVQLRPLAHRDADRYAEGTRDGDVLRYAHLPLSEYTAEIVRQLVDTVVAEGLREGTLLVLTIADAVTDEFLGSVVLFDVREDRAEVGFWLAPWARGRGVAGRALDLVSGLARTAGLTALEARTLPENAASRRLLERGGFTCGGEPAESVTPDGELRATLHYDQRLDA